MSDGAGEKVQGRGEPVTVGAANAADRRSGVERRRFTLRTLLYGMVRPRRRRVRRAGADWHPLDWHESHLLVPAITIVLLSVLDAFLTLNLLSRGAEELNPLMDTLFRHDLQWFTGIKMLLTGAGVVTLVFTARLRLFRLVQVRTILYCSLAGYLVLIWYELSLLGGLG